jgi:16S rRNA (uracil1498-N3)-methyltransferase
MARIYLPTVQIKENRISITGEKARYLAAVLRCRKGDELIIFNGTAHCLRTMITGTDKKEVAAEVLEVFPCDTESHAHIILVQALLKGEKMDFVVQKATELGIKEIIPAITERSQLRETRKGSRWRKIAEEATRQSGRSSIPDILEPVSLEELFTGHCRHGTDSALRGFIFHEEGGINIKDAYARTSLSGDSRLFVFIGPEGGFTKNEVRLARDNGFIVTSLGRRILRAETAAISAVALIQFLSGDFG